MKLALALFVVALAASALAQDSANVDASAALRTTSLDELIRQLPPVGSEGKWDSEADVYVPHPAVKEIKRRFGAGERLTDAQWRAALVSTGAVRLRSKWPATEPLAASLRMPGWLGVAQLRLDPRSPTLKSIEGGSLISHSCGTCASWDERRDLYRVIGELPLGKHELEFAAEIHVGESWLERSPNDGLPPGLAWKGPFPWAVEIVPTLMDAMPPVSNDTVDAAVRRSITVAFSDWADGRTALLVLDPDVCANPCLAPLALSLEVDLMQGDEVRASNTLFASDADRLLLSASVSACDSQSLDFRTLDAVPAALEQDAAARSGWRLRVRGTAKDILRRWDATAHWNGRIEIPLDEAIRRENERAGAKGRGPWCWIPGPR